ncbi:tRNA adenosine(34) deaminase TadA [Streptomyces xinghaiensis]|uniref:tRNA adenosine(34) deaminase TadA n=1 Tax=Streptomyces xinghaiensis TaxID=1038928 RepID=UPI000BAE8355|nr:tRNA adenosine(34) deaminase TadA [Streptomyces xinghaiensis]
MDPTPSPAVRTGRPGPDGRPEPPHDPVRDRWRPAMRLALAEAARAPETGDVPVGAVVLGPDGAVLGRGRNEREAAGDPTAHAEVLALREAARARGEWRLSGCTLVVTLEPCTMCAGAAVLSRVDRIVYGAPDAKAGAAGSLWDVVRDRRLNHRPEVIAGVLTEECAAPLTRFFRGGEP